MSPASDTGPPRPAATREQAASALLDTIRALRERLGQGGPADVVSLDSSLDRDLLLGSLERVELLSDIESRFGVRLPDDAMARAETPRDLLALLDAGEVAAPAGPTRAAITSILARPRQVAPAPEEARTLIELLDYRATRDGDLVHLVLVADDGTEEPLRFGELRAEAQSVAAGLRAAGLGGAPGARPRVAIMLPTGRAYFATFMGALLAGAIPVPIYPPVRLDRIAEYMARQSKILESAGAAAVVTVERAARLAELARARAPCLRCVLAVERLASASPAAVRAEVGPEDTALLQYTSGSTGAPKGVELTHANVLANVRASVAGASLDPEDVMVTWLPLYHDMGLIAGWLMNLYRGNRALVLSPLAFLSRPERWLETISRHRATRSVAPNFAFELCVKRVSDEVLAKLDLRSLRTVLNGAEPVSPATIERFAARFAPAGFRREAMFPGYGLAENMVAVAFSALDREPRIDAVDRDALEREGRAVPLPAATPGALRFVSAGRPVPTVEVRVADEQGAPLSERREGRLLFRGPSAFKGYFGDPEATARVKLADGWNDSGDRAYVADGEIYITGRVKDIIIKGGRNFYPHEIEIAAGVVPGVRQGCVAAFGVASEEAGTESIVVVAETRVLGAEERRSLEMAIREAVFTAVGVPPDRVILAPPGAVPKTSSGKIRRSDTRRLLLAGELGRGEGSFARQAVVLWLGAAPARLSRAARRVLELAFGLYAAAVFLAVHAALVLVHRLVPAGETLRRAFRTTARLALGLTGLRPRVAGLERLPEGPAVVVANHASYIDPYPLVAALPADVIYVIKGEMRSTPVVGRGLGRAGYAFIDRQDTKSAVASLEELAARLREGRVKVLIFPEGTFTREVGLRPFKIGGFRLACAAGVPVVPLVLRGTRRVLRDGRILLRPAAIEVEILDPIAPSGSSAADASALRDLAAAAIAARLDEPRLRAAGDEPSP